MANDLFGNLGGLGDALGGLVGGLAKSGLVPQDDPGVKLLNAQNEVNSLHKQEAELLQEIGREAYEQDPSAWPQDAKLQLIRQNIAAAQTALDEAKMAQEEVEAAKAAEDAKGRCPNCGYQNMEGTKFCQECGTKLGDVAKTFCTSCGEELAFGTRFCGGCGARQED